MPNADSAWLTASPRGSETRLAAQLAMGYAALAALWLVGVDLLLEYLFPRSREVRNAQVLLGITFVLPTAFVVFAVVHRTLRQRARMLAAAARSERDYRMVFDANPNPMYLFDAENLRFLAVNQAMVNRYGYSREELLALTLADIRPEDELPQFHRDMLRVRDAGPELWVGQYRHRRRDGSEFDVEIYAHLTRFNDHPARMVMALDISDRVNAQRALAASEERYRQLVELMPEAVLLLEDNERVFFANPAAAALFGVAAPSDLIGRPLEHLVAPSTLAAQRALNRAVLSGDLTRQAFTPCVLQRGDGSLLEAECAAVPFAGGGPRYLQLLLRDMSEWQATQRKLAAANDALGDASRRVIEAQERERRNLARELHDEIGQALSAIAVRQQLLLAAHGITDDDPHAVALSRLLAETLEQTRSLSLQLRPSQLDDFGLPSAMRALVKRLFADTGIHCELEIEGVRDGPPDRAAVTAYRIVQECLTNVLRHAGARHLRIELLGDAQVLRLKVIDDGRGFEPGTVGAERLGLSGIRERVALHGGRLAVRSRAGLGTAVEAVLPLDDA